MATTTVNVNVAAAGTSGQVQFNNGGAFGADSAFHWDNTNKRLGVGVTPTVTLDVKGSATSGFDAIKFQSQYSAVGYLGTDNTRAWLSSGSGQDGGSVAVESSQVRLRSTNTIFLNNSGVEIARFDQTNLHIGPVATPGARLDVRAQGALSTDIAFRVRNSANNANIFSVTGNGNVDSSNLFTLSAGVNIGAFTRSNYGNVIDTRTGNGRGRIYSNFTGGDQNADALFINVGYNRTSTSAGTADSSLKRISEIALYGVDTTEANTYIAFNFGQNNPTERLRFTFDGSILIGTTSAGTNATKTLAINTGTAPTTSPTDTFQLYSADIVAGNAAPHFRTENGSVIKLYQQSSAGITTVADLVTVLQNLGLLS
jgi:hypothetical protein